MNLGRKSWFSEQGSRRSLLEERVLVWDRVTGERPHTSRPRENLELPSPLETFRKGRSLERHSVTSTNDIDVVSVVEGGKRRSGRRYVRLT